MSNLVNQIENYIKRLLDATPNSTILLQRKELSDLFQCVPSQINYVLSTRFTPSKGYIVDSRRGGGGYIRIRKLDLTRGNLVQLTETLSALTERGLSAREAADLIRRLAEARIVTRREELLMIAALENLLRHMAENEVQKQRMTVLMRMLEVLLLES